MKDKKTIIILIMLFALFMIVSYLLYDNLSNKVDSNQIIVNEKEEVNTENIEENKEEATETNEESTETNGESTEKVKALDFTVTDIDENEVKLSDFFGKPIVLNFWASWCGPCQSEMPDFNEKYLEIGEDIQFLMINATDGYRETVESASKLIKEKKYEFPVFYDTYNDASITYEVYSLPTTWFIDSEGYIVAQAVGAISSDILQQGIDLIK